MGKIENALNSFKLKSNFTINQLEEAYNLKKKVVEIDFVNSKVDTTFQRKVNYEYQLLKNFYRLRNLIKNIDLKNDNSLDITFLNIFPDIDEFYKQDDNKINLSHLLASLKIDLTSLDIDMENAKTKEELEQSFNNFMTLVIEDLSNFINKMLKNKFSNKDIYFIKDIIFQNDISIKDIIVRTYNFCVGEENLVTTEFKEKIEIFEHNSAEYHKGLKYFADMFKSKKYQEAVEIYNNANNELFANNTKSNARK